MDGTGGGRLRADGGGGAIDGGGGAMEVGGGAMAGWLTPSCCRTSWVTYSEESSPQAEQTK